MKANNKAGVLEMASTQVIKGSTIKVLRIIKKQTLKDMAEFTGISVPTLSHVENDNYNLTPRNQWKLSAYLIRELGYTKDEIIVIQAFIQDKKKED